MIVRLMGQAGVEITLTDGTTILIDPYFSDTLREQKGERFARLVPPPKLQNLPVPDVIAITHDHLDHLDMATLAQWLGGEESRQILGPLPVYRAIVQKWPARHNVMVMRPGVEVSIGNALICAVPASHETLDAVGYLIKAEGKSVYLSGDTLYTREIPAFLDGESIDLALVCINGFGNNMNAMDAARLVNTIQPKLVIPIHWDMFLPFGANPKIFAEKAKQIPVKILKAYETIEI